MYLDFVLLVIFLFSPSFEHRYLNVSSSLMHLRGLFLFSVIAPPSQHHTTNFSLSSRITHGKRSKMKRRQRRNEMETDREARLEWGEKACWCLVPAETCSPLPGFFVFSHFVAICGYLRSRE